MLLLCSVLPALYRFPKCVLHFSVKMLFIRTVSFTGFFLFHSSFHIFLSAPYRPYCMSFEYFSQYSVFIIFILLLIPFLISLYASYAIIDLLFLYVMYACRLSYANAFTSAVNHGLPVFFKLFVIFLVPIASFALLSIFDFIFPHACSMVSPSVILFCSIFVPASVGRDLLY